MTTIKLSFGSKKYKSWVAEITGQDTKYGFARKFLNIDDRETAEVTLANGVYQINGQGASDFYDKAFIVVKDGEVTEIEEAEVMAAIEAMNAPAEEEVVEEVHAVGRKTVDGSHLTTQRSLNMLAEFLWILSHHNLRFL